MALRLASPPAEEPVSLDEAKLHLRIDHSEEDALIAGLIGAARRHIEETVLSRALITQTWELYLDRFPAKAIIKLPRPPLQSVESIKYTLEDGSEATFSASNYIVDNVSEPGRIVLKRDASWPADTLIPVNGVKVTFAAGYGDDPADVPDPIKQAMLLLIGDLYENREESIVVQGLQVQRLPFGVQSLLYGYQFPPELTSL